MKLMQSWLAKGVAFEP